MKKSQLVWVKEQLETYGAVGRNQALQNRITRLGAIIFQLKSPPHNMIISTDYEGPEGDCVYHLTRKTEPPKKTKNYVEIRDASGYVIGVREIVNG